MTLLGKALALALPLTLPALLLGCLEGDFNPLGQPDASSGTPAVVLAGTTCSGPGTQPVTLTFENRMSNRSLDLLWVDQHCTEVKYATLWPGANHVQPTFVGHPWRLRDTATGALYKEYVAVLPIAAEVTVP